MKVPSRLKTVNNSSDKKRVLKGQKGQKENIYKIITLDTPIFVLVIDFRNDTKKKCLSLEAHKLRTDKTC